MTTRRRPKKQKQISLGCKNDAIPGDRGDETAASEYDGAVSPLSRMRTATTWVSMALVFLQTVPASAQMAIETTADETVPLTATEMKKAEEAEIDAMCRTKLNIAEGRITKGFQLFHHRRCMNDERKARLEKKKAEADAIKRAKISDSTLATLAKLRRGSNRVITNQGAVRQGINQGQNARTGRKTFVRVNRRATLKKLNEPTGTGSVMTGSGTVKP